MLRLASSEAKKRATQKKEKKRLKEKGPEKPKKKKKARRVLLTKTKVTKHGSRIAGHQREREGSPIGPRIRFSFFFLDL
jgi:hypothetical protein